MTIRDGVELRRGSLRLALQIGALIVVLFTLLGGVVFVIVSSSQAESIQRTLINTSRVDSPGDAPAGAFVIIADGQGTHASSDLPLGLPDNAALQDVSRTGRNMQQTKTVGDHSYTIRTTADHGRVTQVAMDLRESREELQRLGTALVVSGIVAALAAGLVAAWMARRAMRPLAEALALQRRFVTDASHELRTPLTLLSTRAQLVRHRLPKKGTAGSAGDVASVVRNPRGPVDRGRPARGGQEGPPGRDVAGRRCRGLGASRCRDPRDCDPSHRIG